MKVDTNADEAGDEDEEDDAERCLDEDDNEDKDTFRVYTEDDDEDGYDIGKLNISDKTVKLDEVLTLDGDNTKDSLIKSTDIEILR